MNYITRIYKKIQKVKDNQEDILWLCNWRSERKRVKDKGIQFSILVEFPGHKMENTKYYSNDKSNSRFVISMPENLLIPIFMSCVNTRLIFLSFLVFYSCVPLIIRLSYQIYSSFRASFPSWHIYCRQAGQLLLIIEP